MMVDVGLLVRGSFDALLDFLGAKFASEIRNIKTEQDGFRTSGGPKVAGGDFDLSTLTLPSAFKFGELILPGLAL